MSETAELPVTTPTPEAALPTRPRTRRDGRTLPLRGLRFATLRHRRIGYTLAISARGKRRFIVRSGVAMGGYAMSRSTNEEFTSLKRATTRFERLLRTQLKRGYRESAPGNPGLYMLKTMGFRPEQIEPAFTPILDRLGEQITPTTARRFLKEGWRAEGLPERTSARQYNAHVYLSIDAAGNVIELDDRGDLNASVIMNRIANLGRAITEAGLAPALFETVDVWTSDNTVVLADVLTIRGRSLAGFDEQERRMLIQETAGTLHAQRISVLTLVPLPETTTPKGLDNARLISPSGRIAWSVSR